MHVLISANLLGKNGGRVTTQGLILAGRLSAAGFRVSAASSYENRVLRLIDIVLTIVRNGASADLMIVEVYSGLGFLLVEISSLLGKLFRLPTAFVLHGGNLPNFAAKYPRWIRRVLMRADILAAPSDYLAEAISSLGFKIRVIPNIIDLGDYEFRLRSAPAPRLIWMRSFHEIYNPMMAIETFVKVREKYPNATLVMAGPDKGLETAVKIAARDLGVEDAVRFPGFLDSRAKSEELSQADIYINTNRVDNMPVSVVEACACGLPVVATNVGGIGRLLTHEKTGLLVESGDAVQMADAVIRLVRDSELAARLSLNGRELAERSDWNTVRAKWDEVFDDLVHARRNADGRRKPATGVGQTS